MMKFRGVVELNGRTATGIEVTPAVLESLGSGKRPKVRATINGYTYRSSVGSLGGRFLLPVSADVRANAGVSAGDEVTVDLELDTEPRTVDVPADLAEALGRDPAVRRAFDALSHSNQSRHVLAVEGAKAAATRQRRIDRILEELRGTAAGR